MAELNRHHFVPQYYLRNFAVDCGPTGPRRIGLFNIPRGLFVRSASIKAQAKRRKLYGDAATETAARAPRSAKMSAERNANLSRN